MKIAVWKTNHPIADTVAEAVYEGRSGEYECERLHTKDLGSTDLTAYDLHLSYGILRGSGDVFRQCQRNNIPWVNLDRGYFLPGHYSGFYRISLNGTQQTFGLDKLEPDYARWDALGIEIDAGHVECSGYNIICPPTIHAANFFGITDDEQWNYEAKHELIEANEKFFIRYKSDDHPIDYKKLKSLITFNSSVGWEALRQGIEVVSDPTHSILGAYDKLMDKGWQLDYEARKKFFAIQASLQMTLAEMKQGSLWPLLQKLLSL